MSPFPAEQLLATAGPTGQEQLPHQGASQQDSGRAARASKGHARRLWARAAAAAGPRHLVRGLVGLALLALAGRRAAAAAGLLDKGAGAAAELPRRLQEATGRCQASSPGLPLKGVRYIPHLVGEPYPHPESAPEGYYSDVYAQLHKRDLPLISGRVGADALSLSPWTTTGPVSQRAQFFEEMRGAGICKVVPTFHVAKFYADMLREGVVQPKTDPSSAFAVDFMRFGASVQPGALGDVEMVAWSVDLSLDLYELLPLVAGDCEYSKVPQDKGFQRYMGLVQAIQEWVHPEGTISVAPALASAPFLVPLDISRVSWTEPSFQLKLNVFLKCMSRGYAEGGWSSLFSGEGVASGNYSNRWLFSFAEPMDQQITYNFSHQLLNLSLAIREHGPSGINAVVMAGTQALKHGEGNPINSANLVEDFTQNGTRYQKAFQAYEAVLNITGNLDGFIYDEWMDDWDRGTRGPFFLAAQTLEAMKDRCMAGSRFTHNIDACSRVVGNNALTYPEFFGLVGTSSQLLKHCVHPRFIRSMFGGDGEGADEEIGRKCAFTTPSPMWVRTSLVLLALVMLVQVLRMVVKWCCSDSHEPHHEKQPKKAEAGGEPAQQHVGYITISPEDSLLCGNHMIELQSKRVRSDEEAGWWLWTHVSAQMRIFERQVRAEVNAIRALRARSIHRSQLVGEALSASTAAIEDEDTAEGRARDLTKAMQVIHRRTLEGFAAWCLYVAGANKRSFCQGALDPTELRSVARQLVDNSVRTPARLFAEALLLRVMESLGEQILQCPERLSYLLFHIFKESGGLEVCEPALFAIDMEQLQDGLPQMNLHTNPYVRHKMPNGKWELGLNFDDINESGIQCRENVAKTFKEPASMMVLVDFFICYRVPIMLKLYCLALSGYIYLGSSMGDDISTTHNGSFFHPRWLRINYVQYVALLDALLWASLEVVLVVYVAWQRGPSLCYKSPGIPGIKWLLEHTFNICLSALGGMYVYASRKLVRKPWECAEADAGLCDDPRAGALWEALHPALFYWGCRTFIFLVMNGKHVPIFIYGTPDSKVRKESGRGIWHNRFQDMRVNFAWLVMLGACVLVEVFLLLPTMKGLDWNTTCGMDVLGEFTGLPMQRGVCTEADQEATFGCVTCLSCVLAGWFLVLLGSMVDIYFVFYFASAIVGSAMGHKRHLNDLKNVSLPIDLREHQGREALLFERTFGPGWQHVWRVMVKSLLQESFISPKQATGLLQAAGISMDGEAPLTHRDKKQKPIHLARFPHLAAERLAFFFQSLKWIENFRPSKGACFEPATDALTGVHFDPGTIPSLTQIIPAYNEVVIPSLEFLRAGAEPEDARNGSPDDQPGLGDLTVPPQGDGVNTNLAFMISQFPDEWVFMAKRLQAENRIETAESQELYHDFMKQRLSPECVAEVRLWTALRMQSVAKTVIGALQYGRALASLPKIKEHYAQFPGKRLAEDHVEVILAHQTYGHPEGNPKNDEAVQLLLEKYADDALYLVFDLKKGTSAGLWRMVEDFLVGSGGYCKGAFQQASVKCKWNREINGLQVLEVLPRWYPLRLGQGEYKTQGKACNQLNGLRFASGHYVQALDCNMGTFIGEGFKVPYVLRTMMPLDKEDRTAPRCRYLGFREYIYTGREGTVGKCHAAAEWTFGTIYQRFLSGMGMRMHYGHPDFLDGFWARNRGGMSKSSPVVNLSEDIFAGFNVRMREEASPHIDALEFEKGREATFNAASNFFSKISGGSVSVIRSRDNHLLCERIGIFHSLGYYFTSVAFYTSNLLVDMSIYLYVGLFVLFNLAGLGPGALSALGSSFSTEWIVSMGLVTLVPQLCEMVLEHGAVHACKEVFGGLLAATFFFIFQNKNIASSMKEGAMTGIARYFFTGRPSANQHQTWRDIYISYWKSHYKPAMNLAMAYLIYSVLALENRSEGKLPMVLVVISFVAWIITPIVFSPFPRWNLIAQDMQEFNNFITGGAGSGEGDIPEVVSRGVKGTVRTLYECGLAEELSVWSEQHFVILLVRFAVKIALGCYLAAALPAGIMDFLPIFLVVLSFSWVVVLGYFAAGLNNVVLVLSFVVWGAGLPLAHLVIGTRSYHPNTATRMPEYVISMAIFLYFLGLAKEFVIFCCRALCGLFCKEEVGEARLLECIRICFVYFFVHQLHIVEAYIVMCANTATSVLLATVDQVFCNGHTWFLLNSELARTRHGERYMEKNATFFELDRHSLPYGSDLWSASDSESDCSTVRQDMSTGRNWA